jgi:rRNA maturation endonuclease Nob1
MGEDEIKKRKKLAEKILKNIYYCKLCEGCESVILIDSIFCPVCDGYRFDKSLEHIEKAVHELANKKQSSVLPADYFDEYFGK